MKVLFFVASLFSFLFAAQNHSGTISASEHWTLANSPHHVTGSITINVNDTVYWDPGIYVYFDGGYTFTVNGTLYAVGTSSSLINSASNVSLSNGGQGSDYTLITTMGNNSSVVFNYVKISNGKYILASSSTGISVVTNNCQFYKTSQIIVDNGGSTTYNYIFNNCDFINLRSGLAGDVVGHTGNATFNACYFYRCYIFAYQIATSQTYTFNSCFFNGSLFWTCTGETYAMSTCLLNPGNLFFSAASTGNSTLTGCIMANSTNTNGFGFGLNVTSGGAHSFTNCDFMNFASSVAISNPSNTSPTDTIKLTSCYMTGSNSADINNYFTGSQTPAQVSTNDSAHFKYTTMRTTRNFTFIPASITNTTPTNSLDTIKWTTDFKTAHRVLYGKTSGSYPYMSYPNQSWSGWDGTMQDTTNAAIPITNLSPGTKYYYVAQSWDWVMETWNQSAEGNFTTAGVTPASNDSLLRYIVYHDLDSSKFNRSTGVKTVYNSAGTGSLASWNFTEDANGIYRSSATITSDTNTIPDSLNSWLYQYRFNAATYRKADSMWCILKTNGTDTLARIKNYNISGYTVHGKAH